MPLRKLVGLMVLLFATASNAASVGLKWDENTEADLSGYRVYSAPFSLLNTSTAAARANPSVSIWEVGTTTTTDIYLKGDTTYYFRATAFDVDRNESGFNIKLSTGGQPMQDEVSAYVKRADINGDGKVDLTDLSLLLSNYEK